MYLVLVASAMLRAEMAYLLERVGSTLIGWRRHGQGEHINRVSGHSHIDQRRDQALCSRRGCWPDTSGSRRERRGDFSTQD
jgi:hypothetical protein